MEKTINHSALLQMEPIELATYLHNQYVHPLPEVLETTEDLQKAGILLGQLANAYSYLNSMLVFAKLAVREEKRKKSKKEIIDNAIDRRDTIELIASSIKMQYTAISRAITVKKQIDDEINML